MLQSIALILLVILSSSASAQQTPRKLQAERTNASFKIDGVPDEAAWLTAVPVTGFIEQRPNAGNPEDTANRSIVYILYDNTSVYVGGYFYERTSDSISKELVGRDNIGVNDFAGIVLDTYNDKINGVGFFLTPYGEQFDIKYMPTSEDLSWSAVWKGASRIHDNGWSFEMQIPYSALRFVSKESQTWGMNIFRRRNKTAQQFTWSPIDPKVGGFMNQEGEWTNIGKIEAPLRLSFSPYMSAYVNHYKPDIKDWRTSINGGMDVKYGINDAFTLDMTLIPDFGQVQSDNQVLNLSPFEVRFNENRTFFTEGTELFNKGDLFYSRRIGGRPIHYWDVNNQLGADEKVVRNPQESKLINASKISGRTRKGLGIGFFNALTKPMYAEVENNNKKIRRVETDPLTNYNIIVFDQNLKNNSSVSFINTNVMRSGQDYDANVSAALLNLNDKKNIYNLHGKFAVSQLMQPGKNVNGYAHTVGFFKKGGRWNFQVMQELTDDKYDINDMGILFNNNFVDHYFWTRYIWIKPTRWYNRIQVNYNAYYSMLFNKRPGQKIDSRMQVLRTNVNGHIQMKNLWWAGMYVGFGAEGNDFYEPRQKGWSFRTSELFQLGPWLETNSSKKYYFSFNYFISLGKMFKSRNYDYSIFHRYRFNDKFSLTHQFTFNPFTNDAGYYSPSDINGNPMVLDDIIFSRRDRKTIQNILSAKYNFNNRSGITFRARHYSSKVEQKELYDLQSDGRLIPTSHAGIALRHQNYNIFNIDAVYTWQFAPGSFINIVWKDESSIFDQQVRSSYFRNLDENLSVPQNNNLSIKVIYYLDYLDFRKWRTNKKKVGS